MTFSKLSTQLLSLHLRRCPWESLRWRLIPLTLQRCKSAFFAPDSITVRTRHGFQIILDRSDWLGRHIYVTGEYEPSTSRLVKGLLRPGDSFIDVGANIGYFTLLAATCVGLTGRVFAYEPVPEVYQRLQQNVALNQLMNCTAEQLAISNETYECEFFVGPRDHAGTSSIREISDITKTIKVRTARLDDLLA